MGTEVPNSVMTEIDRQERAQWDASLKGMPAVTTYS